VKLLHAMYTGLNNVHSVILYNAVANSISNGIWTLKHIEGQELAVSFGCINHDIDGVRIGDVAG
jgi:hypothetical protein